jgi:hypothetical protein
MTDDDGDQCTGGAAAGTFSGATKTLENPPTEPPRRCNSFQGLGKAYTPLVQFDPCNRQRP